MSNECGAVPCLLFVSVLMKFTGAVCTCQHMFFLGAESIPSRSEIVVFIFCFRLVVISLSAARRVARAVYSIWAYPVTRLFFVVVWVENLSLRSFSIFRFSVFRYMPLIRFFYFFLLLPTSRGISTLSACVSNGLSRWQLDKDGGPSPRGA